MSGILNRIRILKDGFDHAVSLAGRMNLPLTLVTVLSASILLGVFACASEQGTTEPSRSPRVAGDAGIYSSALVVALTGFSTTSSQADRPSVVCPSWNLAAEFRVSPNQANPNPDNCGNSAVWYFLRGNGTARPALLQVFTHDLFAVSGLDSWMGPFDTGFPNDLLPQVSVNATGATQSIFGITWPAGVILVHPWTTQAVVVSWRSPVTGTVGVTGGVSDLDANCGNGIVWSVHHGAVPMASGAIPNGGTQNFASGTGGSSLASVWVVAGDFLSVTVGPKQRDYVCDSTGLDLTITPTS